MYSSSMFTRFFLATTCAVVLSLAPLQGQSTMGTITGIVTDSSGAVIPNAVVVATNTATGGKAQTLTSATGNYLIPGLQVGQYEVSVAISGFKAWTRSRINVNSNGNVRIDVALEVGQATERVT